MACWWWYVSCPYKYLTKSQKNHVIPQICYAASEFIFPYKTILIGVRNSVNCKIYRGPGVPPMWMSVWTYKAMSMPTPLHSHQSVHELLCDQMLNGPYSCWVKHMEMKGEQTNGQMLKEKWSRFKVLFNVPDEERLSGDGCIASFCRAYKICKQRRHGEAGSVDLATVKMEQVWVRGIFSKFAPRDWWNFDETSFFPWWVLQI